MQCIRYEIGLVARTTLAQRFTLLAGLCAGYFSSLYMFRIARAAFSAVMAARPLLAIREQCAS